ncbi:hypothetical protein TUZN_0576 [Thermoproteus uzoniensis 768-20]|uniref:Uncharacterized protein n=1 Tax=Thermoproteus uzoniensis (strain 768-20) TaxID=999630 RepID=F2L3T6_THEU7|nr:hypothetical protein TUZN_0576 [Thermoproteus uzoniensis 768-20]
MILYGTPEVLLRALEKETTNLLSLRGKDPHLDKYIDSKLRILKECYNKIKKSTSNQLQIVAISACYVIEL